MHHYSWFVSASVAKAKLGVTSQTLRRWAKAGLIAHIKTPGGHYRYCIERFLSENDTVRDRHLIHQQSLAR